jgi:hypothetical protein
MFFSRVATKKVQQVCSQWHGILIAHLRGASIIKVLSVANWQVVEGVDVSFESSESYSPSATTAISIAVGNG